MRVHDIYTTCKQSDVSFISTLLRHWYWRILRHANMLLSPRVYWVGKGKTDIKGRVTVGFDDSILSHPNTPTIIKMFGNLIVNGIARIQRGCRIEIGEGATLELNNCFVNNNCLILCEHGISIGAETSIGWNTQICDEDYHGIVRANTQNHAQITRLRAGGG